jgi:alpha-mannosidase
MRTLAKNRFAFKAENEKATFDLGLGAIERGNMSEKLFEVPAQRWADITDKSGEFGVSVISECKHGWDKFNDNTLRLTVLHTPKWSYRIDSMQAMMDLGLNLYSYAVYPHKGGVGADIQLEARKFVTPMVGVTFPKHQGALGSSYSFAKLNTDAVIIRCLKKKHHSDRAEYVVRFNEGTGKEVKGVTFTIGDGIDTACEIWASEEYLGEAEIKEGKLVFDMKPYEVKSFAFTLKAPQKSGRKLSQKPLEISADSKETEPLNDIIPKTLLKDKITACGIEFNIGETQLIGTAGERFDIGNGRKLALLCNNRRDDRFVNNSDEAYARWDLYDFGETAYIKDGQLGYEFTHTVSGDKVNFAKSLYYWVVTLDENTPLPEDMDICVLAATEIEDSGAKTVTPLIDRIENNRPFTFKKNFKELCWYLSSKCVWNLGDKDDFIRHNNNGKNGKRIEQSKKNFSTKTFD